MIRYPVNDHYQNEKEDPHKIHHRQYHQKI